MAKGESLADQLFNRDTVGQLAAHFAGAFDTEAFLRDVMVELHDLELKARINHIAAVLARYLPQDFAAAAQVIDAALPPPLDPNLTDNDFGSFTYASLGVFVENHGRDAHFSTGLDLIEALTMRFSMEFSIRAFLNADQTQTMARVLHWARHDHYHVRRLASEGTRPRLPWGQNVGLTVADTLPVLDVLHADPTRFVTRSVANHLNDIAKIDPDAVIDQLENWQSLGLQSAKELEWMRKHALRSLIKSGHTRAMIHLGYRPDVKITAPKITVPAEIVMGDKVAVEVAFIPNDTAPLIVDYVIDYVKANGTTAPKAFKLKSLSAKADVPVAIAKTHFFDPTASTRKLYAGAHRIHLQITGRIIASQDFTLS